MNDKDTKPNRKIKQSAFHVYTGLGKGKSTASLGLMLRALGAGLKVCYVRMLKPRWKTGELKLCTPDFHPNLKFYNLNFYWALCVSKHVPQDIEQMRKNLEPEMVSLRNMVQSGDYDLFILDEINYCLYRKLIKLEAVLKIIDQRSANTELVFTGRHAHVQVRERADYLMEIHPVKHPFRQGIRARSGIEF